MRNYTFTIIFLLVSTLAMAVPATPDTLYLRQPDGKPITLLLHGDEHFHYYTDLHGQWMQPDENGFFKSVIPLSEQQIEQQIIESPIRKSRQKHIAKRSFPTKGTQKSLVILAQFEDLKFTTRQPRASFSTMLNQIGYAENGATGSARDYFVASSNGQFTPQFIVVGPYTLPHTMSYYGGNGANGKDRPARLMQFCHDAVEAANEEIDFTEYDTDNDGYIDNVFIFYAGYSEAEGGAANSIWSHQYGVVPDSVIGSSTFDGKTISSYACSSELRGYSGNSMSGIGTFCHEFGHVLGLPDYYHTAKNKVTTLGRWDIMDNGSYLNNGNTPATHSAFNRFYLGWLSPVQINEPTTLNLYALSQRSTTSTQPQAYLIADGIHNIDPTAPNINEYFIVEYRKKTGWDAYMPDSGMIIWHIDYNSKAWADNTVNNTTDSIQTLGSHMRVFIENPNGIQTHSDPAAFHENDTFTPTLWSGIRLNQDIDKIKEYSDHCTFNFMGGGIDRTAPVAIEPEVISYNSMLAAWHPVKTIGNEEVDYMFTAFTLAGGDTAYVVRRELVSDTTYMLSNLKKETIYTYFVSAYIQSEDKATETFRSNIIKATTVAEKSVKRMSVYVVGTNGDRQVYVNKPSASDDLYIFNEASQLIQIIRGNDNLVCLTSDQLPSGHTYILRAGSKYAKIIL